MRVLWIVVLVLGIPAGMAAQSIHPFFQEDDLVFKPELVGEWNVSGDEVEFRDLGDKAYGAVLRDGVQSAICFRVHLFRIEQKYFFDAQITNIKESSADSAAQSDHPTPAIEVSDRDFELDNEDTAFINHEHLLLRVSLSADQKEFQFSFLHEEWVRTQEETGKLSVAHTKDDIRRLLFIAESDDLRAWVRELPDEAFEKPETMGRVEEKK
jgi:hypothetical protein